MKPDPPSSQAALLALLEFHGLAEPDGRPLYRYHARRRELTELRSALTEELGRPRPGRWAAMGFCLWASEWWRCNYEGGPWKWQPLLAEVEHLEFEPGNARYSQLPDLVRRGLDAWKRRVLRLGPSRRYLATLACEGGLPVSLLQKDTHLRRYMRAVTEQYKLFRSSGIQPQDLAEQARHFLPRSWRQHVVYELAGQLVRKIWHLQQELGESDTVIDLDRVRPGWRDELPIRITNDIARTLLNGLLLDVAEVTRGARVRVRWEVEVIPVDSDRWETRGQFQMPATMDSAMFNRLFDRAAEAPVPDRFDLCVQVHGGTLQPLAIVTRRRIAANGAFGVELLDLARRQCVSGLEQPRELMARSLTDCYRTFSFPGAGGLAQLPWVFAPKDVDADVRQPCRLVGQGSVKIREPWGLVAIPRDVSVQALTGGSAEVSGDLRNANRRMYRVAGRVAFESVDGSRTVVETGTRSSTAGVEYRLHGKQVSFGRSGLRAYLGKPGMHEWHDDAVEPVPDARLEWRPEVPGSRWKPYATSEDVWGSGVLRYTKEGEVCHTTLVCVLPPRAEVAICPSSDPQRGQVLLRSFGDIRAAVTETTGVHANCYPADSDYSIDLTADGDVPHEIAVIVDWHGDGRTELRLPFPTRRAVFLDSWDRELPHGFTLTADRLAGVRAEVIIPPDAAEFQVQGQYVGQDAAQLRQSHGLIVQSMEEVSRGHHKLDLARVQLATDARLLRSDDPDGQVALSVLRTLGTGSPQSPRVRVSRFDLELQTLPGPPVEFRLEEADHARMSEGEMSELEIEALSLADPHLQPTALVRAGTYGWHFPEDALDPGPYLITGRQGAWQRVRPVFWYTGERTVDSLPAASCVRGYSVWSGDGGELDAFESVAHRLSSQPSCVDDDWTLVFAYLDETTLPVRVFPLLRALAGNSEASAMAAVVATPSQFDVLWERMVAFPFAWWQVPMPHWELVLTQYAEYLRAELDALTDLDQLESILAKQLTSRIKRLKKELSGLEPAFEFLSAKLLGSCVPAASARITDTPILHCLLKDYDGHRRGCPALRANPSDTPYLPGIANYIRASRTSSRFAGHLFVSRVGLFSNPPHADYADAPAAAAVSVLSGRKMPHYLARAIREVREYQTEWFDEALRLALLIGFGQGRADEAQESIG